MLGACCPCCIWWKPRQYPIFDYDEVDDVEFENLLHTAGQQPVNVQQAPTIWDTIASLFKHGGHGMRNRRREYEYIPNYDIDQGIQRPVDILIDQDDQEDAKLLTDEQVSNITKPFAAPQMEVPRSASIVGSLEEEPEENFNAKLLSTLINNRN